MHFSKKALAENYAKRMERDAVYARWGYDTDRSVRFVLSKALPLKGRVLEIGTGKGRFLAALLKRVERVTTVDVSSEEQLFARMNVASEKPRGKARYVIADAAALPWRDRVFGAIVSMNALHHIQDLDGMLDEILRVIKPEGQIVLADFSARGFRIFDSIHRQEGRVHERYPHRWSYIAARLRRAGWVVRHAKGAYTELVVAKRVKV